MFKWFEQRWSRRQHLFGADLVLYVDGELPSRKTGKIRRHLDDCWSCRAEKQRLEDAIRQYVELRNAALAGYAELPPGLSERFRRRLAAEDQAARARRHRPLWRPAALAAAAAMLVLAVAIARLATVPRVSADAALSRASEAISSRMSRVAGPVVVERLVLRSRRLASADRAETRVSFSGGVADTEDPVWRDVHSLLSRNGLDAPWPLSPDAFRRWVAQVSADYGAKVVCRQTAGGLEVRVTLPDVPALVIREATLVLGRDWMPLQQTFRVQTSAGACEYVLQLLSFQVEPQRQPAPKPALSVRRTEPPPESTLAAPPPPPPQPHSRDLDEAEIQVQYASHRTGACLRYPLEIVRRGNGIEVRGTVRDGAQRDELMALMPSKDWLSIKLDTPEDLLRGQKPQEPEKVKDTSALVQSGTPLGESLIVAHFRAAGGGVKPVIASARFMTRAVQLSGEAAEHAWTLNRLAQVFPSGRTLEARQPSRRLLEVMVREHAGAIQARLAELRKQLQEVFPAGNAAPSKPPRDFSGATAGLTGRVTEVDRLVRRLFAGQPGEERDALASGRDVMTCLSDVEVLTAAVVECAAGEYGAGASER